ncbi:hypothetical protein THMIRHAS_06600 [Thiosulfatimonas sediminis]|uniref:Uncharacterized protein n=1 Tax=Thiosulfatimonas sediminis TaxID=2675054 RepID=A0A6F8PTC9_9GAMM|nr:hypothetical protein [Thiosulfatimonas sediminis]BBP45287.1 hypothetical protein THMIRHAS_06600 [Thiosulfatimonas sediminis]
MSFTKLSKNVLGFIINELTLSQKIGTQFPYDWSNLLAMSEDFFVRNVFEKGLFRDMLQTVRYFGFERTDPVFQTLEDSLPKPTLRAYENIRIGMLNAKNRRTA